MERIYIPRLLKAPQQRERLIFKQELSELETLTPVRGEMVVAHGHTYLEITVTAETIVTLSCDRCLKNYNARLCVDSTELIWLERSLEPEEQPLEREVNLEDLDESLDPYGYFEPETWLYEQLCLAMPLRKVCDPETCPGADQTTEMNDPQFDSRWAKLADLKQQLFSSSS